MCSFLEEDLEALEKEIGFGIKEGSLSYQIVGDATVDNWNSEQLCADLKLETLEGLKLSIKLTNRGYQVRVSLKGLAWMYRCI